MHRARLARSEWLPAVPFLRDILAHRRRDVLARCGRPWMSVAPPVDVACVADARRLWMISLPVHTALLTDDITPSTSGGQRIRRPRGRGRCVGERCTDRGSERPWRGVEGRFWDAGRGFRDGGPDVRALVIREDGRTPIAPPVDDVTRTALPISLPAHTALLMLRPSCGSGQCIRRRGGGDGAENGVQRPPIGSERPCRGASGRRVSAGDVCGLPPGALVIEDDGRTLPSPVDVDRAPRGCCRAHRPSDIILLPAHTALLVLRPSCGSGQRIRRRGGGDGSENGVQRPPIGSERPRRGASGRRVSAGDVCGLPPGALMIEDDGRTRFRSCAEPSLSAEGVSACVRPRVCVGRCRAWSAVTPPPPENAPGRTSRVGGEAVECGG
ncbi:hypothetical protein C8J57DRAFT_559499 [Mycena rebaudengoi]|nr:hypothetical protein C8J57DRAFT_559499 [Mycena rebaudengoi]